MVHLKAVGLFVHKNGCIVKYKAYMGVDSKGGIQCDDGNPRHTVQDVRTGVLWGNVVASEPHQEHNHHCKEKSVVKPFY